MMMADGGGVDDGDVLDQDNGGVFAREERSNVVVQDDKIR